MLHPGDTVIVAVSGGPDSLCLLHILNSIKKRLDLHLIVAHVNHGIRVAESKKEADFVRLEANQTDIPFEQLTVSVPIIAQEKSLSLEQAGRLVRYQFLKGLYKEYKANKIAIGHHADDQIETVLMRLMRGSGLQGLRGIPAKRDQIIRPLIECNRQEIEDYCKRNNITYFIDSSNTESMFLRNKVRNQLIPLLAKEYNPSIGSSLIKLQTIVQDELNYWEDITKQYLLDCIIEKSSSKIVLDIKKIRKIHVALQRHIIRKGIVLIKDYLADIEFDHIESIRELCLFNRGEKCINLPDNIKARKSYYKLEIFYVGGRKKTKTTQYKIGNKWEFDLPLLIDKEYPQVGIKMTTKLYNYSEKIKEQYLNNKSKSEAYLDYDKLGLPLKIRNRRDGDCFKPLNCGYFKKIKSYFIDWKIPQFKRGQITLVVDNSDSIVWVADYQIDDRFKITKKTKKVLHIKKIIRKKNIES